MHHARSLRVLHWTAPALRSAPCVLEGPGSCCYSEVNALVTLVANCLFVAGHPSLASASCRPERAVLLRLAFVGGFVACGVRSVGEVAHLLAPSIGDAMKR